MLMWLTTKIKNSFILTQMPHALLTWIKLKKKINKYSKQKKKTKPSLRMTPNYDKILNELRSQNPRGGFLLLRSDC